MAQKTDTASARRGAEKLGQMLADLNGPATEGLRNRRAKAPPKGKRPAKKSDTSNADEPTDT